MSLTKFATFTSKFGKTQTGEILETSKGMLCVFIQTGVKVNRGYQVWVDAAACVVSIGK